MIKKLFEKQIVHHSFVLAMVALACGLVIGGVNAFTSPIIDKNKAAARAAAFESVLPGIETFDNMDIDGMPLSIQKVVIGYDSNGDALGYIYEAYQTNKFGHLRIVVSIDNEGNIIGAQFLELTQTFLLNVTEENLQKHVGTQINDMISDDDFITGATVSLDTLQELMQDIADAHQNIVIFSRSGSNAITEEKDVVIVTIKPKLQLSSYGGSLI